MIFFQFAILQFSSNPWTRIETNENPHCIKRWRCIVGFALQDLNIGVRVLLNIVFKSPFKILIIEDFLFSLHIILQELGPWIVREDEPEIDENFMCLDWYNSDLNLRSGSLFYLRSGILWSFMNDKTYKRTS